MQQVNVRGGVFAGPGDAYGGGVFNGNESGFGGLGATYEQAAAGIGGGVPYGPARAFHDGSLGTVYTTPWPSDYTLGLQQQLNVTLKQMGHATIAEDGKLGPETCGAAEYVFSNSKDTSARIIANALLEYCPKSYPSVAKQPTVVEPSSTPSAVPAAAPAPSCPSGQYADPLTGKCVPVQMKQSHATMWIVGGIAAAALLAGAAVFAKKEHHP